MHILTPTQRTPTHLTAHLDVIAFHCISRRHHTATSMHSSTPFQLIAIHISSAPQRTTARIIPRLHDKPIHFSVSHQLSSQHTNANHSSHAQHCTSLLSVTPIQPDPHLDSSSSRLSFHSNSLHAIPLHYSDASQYTSCNSSRALHSVTFLDSTPNHVNSRCHITQLHFSSPLSSHAISRRHYISNHYLASVQSTSAQCSLCSSIHDKSILGVMSYHVSCSIAPLSTAFHDSFHSRPIHLSAPQQYTSPLDYFRAM